LKEISDEKTTKKT